MGKRHERCRQQKRYGHCTNIVVDNATRCSSQMPTNNHQDDESKRAELDQRRHVVIVQAQLGVGPSLVTAERIFLEIELVNRTILGNTDSQAITIDVGIETRPPEVHAVHIEAFVLCTN